MAARRPRGELRIIGGQWRSRRFAFAADHVRPTPDRVRQKTFDWLAPRIRGAHVLDCCAGSGAMGLEALSRGAASALFVEREAVAVAAIRHALTVLAPEVPAEVRHADARSVLTGTPPVAPVDIAFVDPPYAESLWRDLLPALVPWLAPVHLIYIEWPHGQAPDFGVDLVWHRSSRAAQVSFGLAGAVLMPAPPPTQEDPPCHA